MKVEELEKYGAKLEMPKEAMKEQSKIMLRALRREFGFWGMLGVFIDMYFIQRRLKRDHSETQRKAAAISVIEICLAVILGGLLSRSISFFRLL